LQQAFGKTSVDGMRTGVYYSDPAEKAIIEAFLREMQSHYVNPIVVEVEPVGHFWSAEEYHQKYLQKTPGGYCHVDLLLAKPEERK